MNLNRISDLVQAKWNGETLTSTEEEKVRRILQIRELLYKYKTQRAVIPKIKQLFGIQNTQARNLIYQTESIFGKVERADRDFKRIQVEEMLEEAYELAREQEDPKAMTMIAKELKSLHHLDKTEDELPKPSEIQMHQNIIAVLPGQVCENPLPYTQLLEKANKTLEIQGINLNENE